MGSETVASSNAAARVSCQLITGDRAAPVVCSQQTRLERWVPERRERVLARVRQLRDGRLNDGAFGSRGRGRGVFAEQIAALFRTTAARLGYPPGRPELSTRWFCREVDQLPLSFPGSLDNE